MRITAFATLVSSIGTCCATVILLFTLIEMGNQRKSAYMPNLVLGRSNFYIYANKSTGTVDIWSPIKLTESDLKAVKRLGGIPVNLYNIGMGAAKAISFSWKFDVDRYINVIMELDTEKKYMIKFDENRFLQVSQQGIKTYFPMRDLEDSIDYILPTHVEKEPYKLMLPSSYQLLTSIVYTLSCKKGAEFTSTSSLDLNLILNYLDIGNNKHKKEFLIQPHLTAIYTEENRVLTEVSGVILSKEAK